MVTSLGKFLRKLRIENDELLKNMAEKIGVASSTLSSIESGRRNPPKGFMDKLKETYELTEPQLIELEQSLLHSRNEIALNIKEMSSNDRDIAVAFARRFESLSASDKKRIKDILNETN